MIRKGGRKRARRRQKWRKKEKEKRTEMKQKETSHQTIVDHDVACLRRRDKKHEITLRSEILLSDLKNRRDGE